MKTQESRFQVHDELTAPERERPGPQGRALRRRPALELRSACSPARRGAARLRALSLRAAQRGASAAHAAPCGTRGRRAPRQRVLADHAPSAPRGSQGWGSTRSPWRASSTRATSARPRCCATSGRCWRPTGRRPCTSTGGARGGLVGRAGPRSDLARGARLVHQPGHARGRRAARRLQRGRPDAPRRLSETPPRPACAPSSPSRPSNGAPGSRRSARAARSTTARWSWWGGGGPARSSRC